MITIIWSIGKQSAFTPGACFFESGSATFSHPERWNPPEGNTTHHASRITYHASRLARQIFSAHNGIAVYPGGAR
jgi:hypothetical protein